MTNFGSAKIQSVALFRQRTLLLSCYSGSASSSPKQAHNRSHLPTPQYRPSVPYILCITNFSNFDFVDFDSDTSISSIEAFASKVYRVGDRVREMELKALVLVSKQQGFNTVVDILGEMVGKTRVLSLREKSQVAGTMEKFNADDNLFGQKYLVLVADTDTCGEGVSFMSVLILSLIKKYW